MVLERVQYRQSGQPALEELEDSKGDDCRLAKCIARRILTALGYSGLKNSPSAFFKLGASWMDPGPVVEQGRLLAAFAEFDGSVLRPCGADEPLTIHGLLEHLTENEAAPRKPRVVTHKKSGASSRKKAKPRGS